MNSLRVQLPGQDRIDFEKRDNEFQISVLGCSALKQKITTLQKNEANPKLWPVPEGTHHSDLLIRELILKLNGRWDFPYAAEELCHCRAVLTQTVDRAIVNGAHTPAQVSRETTASTSCGTCLSDVQAILAFRLGSKPPTS
jgi:bacterioferritin-associated ferredoxin